ncbi:efflux RND transporter permease subunit [Treponema sp.]|uniref:efflux RND transporter permease subunit n=1 Tax=Treponema sp. TaxID=166 RepID=UPI00257EBB74|nr:efflux RND transporter permease subunit [Treponema sp.]MBE6355455.1 efflux RND transporter permease subunit [Treponema sp.]
MSISKKTLQHPVLTLIVFVLLGIIGIFTIKNVAISLMPDVDSPYLMVRTTYTNAGPESVEKSVTKILEAQLISVSGLKNMTSTSSEGSSTISLEFNYGTDLDIATNNVRDKLDRVSKSLPDDCDSPSIFKMDSDSMPIMRLAVKGNRSVDDLKVIAEDTITDLIEQTDGVAEASVYGGRSKIVRIELSQNRLAAYGLTITDVNTALAKQNLELGGGKITEGTTDYSIRTTGEFSSIEEIRNTIITEVNGYVVKLSDIGTAELGYEDKTSEVYINSLPGVYISVSKQSGKNSVTVANALYEKMEEIKEAIPADVSLEIVSDTTDSIRDTINTLIESCYEGLLLAVIILFLFLKNFKSTIIIAISIPLSLVITMLCMSMAGITLNMMTLTGLILGVGMIVDASIVMIENIYVYRTRGAKPKVAAELGSSEMVMSVVSGNLTTICVFIPFLFFLKDLEMMGQMFKGIIFTVVIALISSLFVAIFLVPVLAGKFLPLSNRKEKPVKFKPLRKFYELLDIPLNAVTKAYRKALNAALNHRAVTVIICVSVLAVSFAFIPTLRINMMPSGSDDSVTVTATLPTGTTLSETAQVMTTLEQICKDEIKGYTNIITSIGTGRGTSSSYKGSIEIKLPDSDSQIDTAATIQQKLRTHFNDFAGVRFNFSQGMMRQMTGSDLVLKIKSDSLNDALSVASQVRDVMDSISDIGEVSIDTTEGVPEVEVVIDRQRAYSFGVNVTTVAKEINYAINGVTSTTYRDNGKEYSVKIMYQDSDKQKVIDLEQIYVTGTNGKVSVANFAEVKKGLGPVSIKRENQTRVVTVSADIVSNANAREVENLLKEEIASTFIIPDNVNITYDGTWQSMQDQSKTYGSIILMAILLVFGVMAGTYESFKAPLINLCTIPFLVIGVVGIYKITGQAISMVSAVGLIMLVGIVVNNGIILVDYTNLLIDRGYKKKEACLEAGASRLRPVLMTTLTTILGMLPMCFATSGSAAMVQPIGVAVVGGLTSSTFVTLFFIPVLYSLIMKEKKTQKSHIRVLLEGKTEQPEAEVTQED